MIPYIKKEICLNCGKTFNKRLKKRKGKVSNYKMKIRGINSITCSSNCSKEFSRLNYLVKMKLKQKLKLKKLKLN